MRWRLLVLLFLLVGSGCQSPCPWGRAPQLPCYNRTIDDFVACKVARDVARQHMHTLYESECWPSCHFQAGFEQAYADVAMGCNGQVPAVAPSPYWNSCKRTSEGHCKAGEWLSGYSIGASHALACRGPYNKVIASGSAGACPLHHANSCGVQNVVPANGCGQPPERDNRGLSMSQEQGPNTQITQKAK